MKEVMPCPDCGQLLGLSVSSRGSKFMKDRKRTIILNDRYTFSILTRIEVYEGVSLRWLDDEITAFSILTRIEVYEGRAKNDTLCHQEPFSILTRIEVYEGSLAAVRDTITTSFSILTRIEVYEGCPHPGGGIWIGYFQYPHADRSLWRSFSLSRWCVAWVFQYPHADRSLWRLR